MKPARVGGVARLRLKKPRLPWTYTPRAKVFRPYTECGGPRIYHDRYASAQALRVALDKLCGPRKTAREFDAGGPEAGTLVGARRAAGLFDSGWGESFPLTRHEQQLYQEGTPRPDPFFAPPTTPHPSNYIEDKLQRLRGTFGPTQFQTPKAYFDFCPSGGFGITCAGPNGEVGWTGGDRKLTVLEVDRFREAYCAPGKCQVGGAISPPAGFKEFVVTIKPRNPAVAVKASCQPVLAPLPVVMDRPVPPLPVIPPPPPVPYVTQGCPPGTRWVIGLTGCSCQAIDSGYPIATAAQVYAACGVETNVP